MNFGLKHKIQKITAVALVVMTVLGLLGMENIITYAYEAQPGMIYCADKSATVETFYEASTSGTHARYFAYGKPVTVVDEVKDAKGVLWYKLSYELKAGGTETSYCQASYVLLDKDVTVFAKGVVTGNDVKLRNDAGTDGTTVLTSLDKGHEVELLDTTTVSSKTWYRVRAVKDGVTYIGWMSGTYIEEQIPDIEVDEEYEDYLVRIGFPESYVHSLAVLHALYPNWVFEPVKTGLDWQTVIDNESYAGRNLIYKTQDDAKKSYASTEYNWYTNTWTIRDTSGWVTAHPDYIAYCMDPRNFLNATNIFMYEGLSYSTSHNIAGVNAILSGTFMTTDVDNGDGTTLNYADTFMTIAKLSGVSPYHLASRVRQEQGVNGTSAMISGTYSGYEGYYNYFNIKAAGTGSAVYVNGLTYAKEQGWNTRYKSLLGGAQFIAKNYISVGQDTLYFQKFDVIVQGGLYTHQYMTNVEAAISESKSVAKAYTDKTQAFVFRIPVYENMPAEAVQFTASGNRNNYLSDLSISGLSLTPTFDGATTSYSVIVENAVSSITVAATPVVSASTVTGTGTYKLNVGTNTIKVNCKSQSGDTKTYTLTVVREAAESQPDTPTYTLTSDKYNIGTYVTGVQPQTSVSTFLAGFKCEGGTAKVLTATGTENTGTVATGNKLAVYVNGTLVFTKEIVIYGDLSGDGKINALDAIKLNRYTIGTTSLTGCYLAAADVSGDGKSNALDAIIINRYTIGLSEIKQR